MSTVTVQVKGLRELTDRLNKLPDKLAKRLFIRGISQGAKVIQDEVAARAPRRGDPRGKPVKKGSSERRYSGNLKAHIVRRKVSRQGQKITYEIGPSAAAWYGRLVETGTRFAAAKPFMRPAIDAKGQAAVERTAEVIEAGLPAEVEQA